MCLWCIINDIRKAFDSNIFFPNTCASVFARGRTKNGQQTSDTRWVFKDKKCRLRNFYPRASCSHYTGSRRRDNDKINYNNDYKNKTRGEI